MKCQHGVDVFGRCAPCEEGAYLILISELKAELAALRAERDALRAAVEEIEERTRPNGDMADLDVNLVARAALGERMEGGQ